MNKLYMFLVCLISICFSSNSNASNNYEVVAATDIIFDAGDHLIEFKATDSVKIEVYYNEDNPKPTGVYTYDNTWVWSDTDYWNGVPQKTVCGVGEVAAGPYPSKYKCTYQFLFPTKENHTFYVRNYWKIKAHIVLIDLPN